MQFDFNLNIIKTNRKKTVSIVVKNQMVKVLVPNYVSDIEIKVGPQFYDGITSKEIHQVLIQGCADMITEKTPNYQHVAANLLNFYLRKEVFGTSDNMPTLLDVINNNIAVGYHSVSWDASTYPSGIYFIKLSSYQFNQVSKVVLVK